MDISIRLVRKDSAQDRGNFFALQKSITLFPDMGYEDKKEYEDKVWQEQFENRNRICYVIETESIYCGECAVKDISADIPEIEIELMREYQHKGIGYTDIIGAKNKREHIVCLRQLSKEKYRDVMLEWIEDLEDIKNLGEAKDKIAVKITKIESKLLDKMELMKTINMDEIME